MFNSGLLPGHENLTLFSIDVCAGAPGSGPFLGLCATVTPAVQFQITQTLAPLGTPVTHLLSADSTTWWRATPFPP